MEVARWIGLVGSPIVALLVYFALADPTEAGRLPESGRRVIGIGIVMAGWWLTEAIPIAATALLPLVLLPFLDVMPMRAAASAYADELIFLFLGGFLLGRAFEKSGLHRRVALRTLLAVGVRPGAIIAGVMGATGVISMWVSNTATAMMMLPIAISLIALLEHSIGVNTEESSGWDSAQVRRFSMALLLGIAYAASIGGIGSPIGTPPNLQFVSNARQLFGDEFTFARWFRIGIPVAALLLPMAWGLLVLVLYRVKPREVPGGRGFVREQLRGMGRMSASEIVTFVVFLAAVTLWIGRDLIAPALGLVYTSADGKTWSALTDGSVAIVAALLLFLIPVQRGAHRSVLSARDIDTVPWSILVLFGGGLSLAAAMKTSGVDVYLGSLFAGLSDLPPLVLLLVIAVSITLLSELASNTAVAATTLPILAAASTGVGVHPYVLMIPATLAASCGFMLPVATPPNAIVFGTGRLTVWEMAKAGFLMDLVAVVTIAVFFWVAGAPLLGLEAPVGK